MKKLTIQSQPVAAFAIATGARLVGVSMQEDGYCTYEFENENGEATTACGRWYTGDTQIDAKVFCRAFSRIVHVTSAQRAARDKVLRPRQGVTA